MTAPRIVFLHIPKTAGQTIHFALARACGAQAVSPVRVHSQAAPGPAQLPPGYRVYSGHLDWEALDTVPAPRFVFTVLRDPLERIASFYFYLRREAAKLSPEELARPERTGMRMVRDCSVDAYFTGGDPGWQAFVRDHYQRTYCTYLVTRRMRGHRAVAGLSDDALLAQAVTAARALDGIYAVTDLGALERDLAARAGIRAALAGTFANAADAGQGESRWQKLSALIERDETRARLEDFARCDRRLMQALGLG
ncbi:sulfotransferase family 2 domain-containing protein [Frigidibacter sp. MR17.24]|uniref:sulfotransferase family 2 domain-containing protein n=1 Tax=Frigidibacter sp. MR17.24 TaxID=3127345 RepID=UPI003012EBDA